MRLLIIAITILFSVSAYADLGRKVSVSYHHATIGVTAGDAITAGSVDSATWGWKICHDAESTSTYLAISDGVDPAATGVHIGPGQCFDCSDCNAKGLIDANVKGQAAGTGYSIIMLK